MSSTKEQWLKETGGFPMKAVLFAQLVNVPTPSFDHRAITTVFDIETEPIARAFNSAKTASQRTKSAPAPSMACAFCTESKKYSFYSPSEFPALWQLLQRSDEVVTFNGEKFDFHVLAKTLGLSVRDLEFKKSTDLFSVVVAGTGTPTSLNNLALVNLGRGKHTAGHVVPHLDTASIKAACKSDVRQTYALYKLYRAGKLKAPLLSLSRKHYDQMPFRGVCPYCRDAASIVEMPQDEMTEGQLADYFAGWRPPTLRCTTCNSYFIPRG